MSSPKRRWPVGAEVTAEGTHFRVWAPARTQVGAAVQSGTSVSEVPLERNSDGYFEGFAKGIGAGALYQFRLDDDQRLYPDPASRFQPEGPHGPSQVIDPNEFQWTDRHWNGASHKGPVIYELHVGTFTTGGTWNAATSRLPHLADVGITLIEVMPVADYSGDFGWGYDGVNWFAPSRLYGQPDDFRRFVDQAHALGVGVILDVVYNHFGPDGNYLSAFSKDYVTDRHKTDWGEAINYDGKNSAQVREFVTSNAAYWIAEFHLDGLRLDATQNIYDSSTSHILREITAAARAAASPRSVFVVAENEPQEIHHVQPTDQNGYGMDALWNDDLHHSAIVALTGHSEAYYTDYKGTPQEFVSAIKWGYLYQGQWYKWQGKRRGTPSLRTEPNCFVSFLENHDQIANSGSGARVNQIAAAGQYRAMTALILLSPQTPMLFQGQEFGSSKPFFYFASHEPELARLVSKGRKDFLSQFPSLATPEMQKSLAEPADRTTFERCQLDWSEVERNAAMVALHRDLIALRKADPVIAAQSPNLDGAVLAKEAFLLRFFAEDGADRILIVNLGHDLPLSPSPEPLLAEPAGMEWRIAWSSEDPKYGGIGTPPLTRDDNWTLPARCAVLLAAETAKETQLC